MRPETFGRSALEAVKSETAEARLIYVCWRPTYRLSFGSRSSLGHLEQWHFLHVAARYCDVSIVFKSDVPADVVGFVRLHAVAVRSKMTRRRTL